MKRFLNIRNIYRISIERNELKFFFYAQNTYNFLLDF